MKYDPERKCPKCGSDFVTTNYDVLSGHLKRACGRCGYDWTEQPLDKDEVA